MNRYVVRVLTEEISDQYNEWENQTVKNSFDLCKLPLVVSLLMLKNTFVKKKLKT